MTTQQTHTQTHSPTFLSKKNAHPRDERIQFIEEGHKYIIHPPEIPNPYTSVTTLVHSNFEKFDADNIIAKMMTGRSWGPGNKYWGMTPDEIKNQWAETGETAARLGTELHYRIECFMNAGEPSPNNGTISTPDYDCPEWRQFIDFYIDFRGREDDDDDDNIEKEENIKQTHETGRHGGKLPPQPPQPYRTEWIIFHEEAHLAGSIDMVFENDDGTLSIYDWKRVKDINGNRLAKKWTKYSHNPILKHNPDTNYWHYSLQLNIYKFILEQKYDKKVVKLVLVRFHPNSETYEETIVPDLQKEVRQLIEMRTTM